MFLTIERAPIPNSKNTNHVNNAFVTIEAVPFILITINTGAPLYSKLNPATSQLPLCNTSYTSTVRPTPTLVTSNDSSNRTGVLTLGSVSTLILLGLIITVVTLVILLLVIRQRHQRRKRKSTINDLSRNDGDARDVALSQVQVQVNNRGIIRRSFIQTCSVTTPVTSWRSRAVSSYSQGL